MLTKRMRAVLVFIQDYQRREGGVSPTGQEIATAIGIKSKGNVSEVLTSLEERGYLRRLVGRCRAIEVLRPVPGGKQPPTDTRRIPIYDAATHQIRGYLP